MSEIVDYFVQPYLSNMPSFNKDMDEFISRIRNIIHLRSDVLLLPFDVMSLYPSIPHDFSQRALNDFLLDRNLPTKVVN